MWLEITHAPFVARLRRLAMAIPARAISALHKPFSGRATTIETRERRAVLMLSRREALAAQIEEARRMHRPVRHLHNRAYSITHDILRGGK